jgi:RNA polymerase sigma-70 factor, ECF subfamily
MIGEEFSQVLAHAKTGSERSIAMLWRDLHPQLLAFLRGLDREAAEDLESETWLRVARGLGGSRAASLNFADGCSRSRVEA